MTRNHGRTRGLALAAGLALAGGAAILVVAAVTGGPGPAAVPPPAPATVAAQSQAPPGTTASPWAGGTPGAAGPARPPALASADAAAMLASFPVPPAARRLTAAPPSPGDVLSQLGFYAREPGQPYFDQLHEDGWWLAAGPPEQVLDWVDKHLPHQFAYAGRGRSASSYTDDFTLPALPAGVIVGRNLNVTVVPASHGQTAIGVRAMVAYARGPGGQ